MANRLWRWAAIALIIGASAGVFNLQPASACGGFFCQNSTIYQNSERIIFTRNRDGTISAYVQIQYTGSAPDFAWILPIPEPIGPENLAVPEDTMAAFTELEVATDPVFVAPEMPQCATETAAHYGGCPHNGQQRLCGGLQQRRVAPMGLTWSARRL